MEKSRITELLVLYYNRQTTDEQELELAELLNEHPSLDEIDPVLRRLWSETKPDLNVLDSESIQMADTIWQNDREDYRSDEKQYHRMHFLKTAWFKYAAAVLLIFGIGAYLYTSQQSKGPISSTEVVTKEVKNDIAPGTNRAVLTLSDGSIIILDSATNGQIAIQQGSSVLKKDGQIIYVYPEGSVKEPNPHRQNASGITYNTMSTPRGGQYQLTLPDGTQVWLNAASSITYPTAFIRKERIVKISGEVYFEVKKNAAQLFIVQTSTDNIEVLGTNFNVNAYADEKSVKTSLLEGSVKVGSAILRPGQAYTNGKVVTTNIEEDVAWKNGYFQFNHASVPDVIRQLSRWYNFEVQYRSKIPDVQFSGELLRNLKLSQVLLVLNKMGVESHIEEANILVIE